MFHGHKIVTLNVEAARTSRAAKGRHQVQFSVDVMLYVTHV